MKYLKTIQINNSTNLDSIHPGQWVQLPSGERGQYLGVTRSRVEVILYNRQGVTKYQSNWNTNLTKLRQFAKTNGSK